MILMGSMSELTLAMGAKAPCEALPRWRLRRMGKQKSETEIGSRNRKQKSGTFTHLIIHFVRSRFPCGEATIQRSWHGPKALCER